MPTLDFSSKTKIVARIHLVRHGETQANRDRIIQGQRDTELNATGLQQASEVAERFKEVKIDRIFSSDLQRAVKTGEAILANHPGLEMVKDKRLREKFMGDLEGKIIGTKLTNGQKEGETDLEMTRRVLEWWEQEILGGVFRVGRCLIVVVTTHGGFIVKLAKSLLATGQATGVDGVDVRRCLNGSVGIIEVSDDKKSSLVSFGDVAHLAKNNKHADLENT